MWHAQVNPSIFAKDFKAYSGGNLTVSDTDVLDEDCLVSREVLLERLKTYIYGVLEYTYRNGYADIIYAWDVVNEACDESQPDGLRNSYWYQIIGRTICITAFYTQEKQKFCIPISMLPFMD